MANLFGDDYHRLVQMERDGEKLANKYRWKIEDIIYVLAVALETSNAHTLRSKIVEVWKADCEELDNMPNPFTNVWK